MESGGGGGRPRQYDGGISMWNECKRVKLIECCTSMTRQGIDSMAKQEVF